MFDYGNANEAQRDAINSTNGLVLITAGPRYRQNIYFGKKSRIFNTRMWS